MAIWQNWCFGHIFRALISSEKNLPLSFHRITIWQLDKEGVNESHSKLHKTWSLCNIILLFWPALSLDGSEVRWVFLLQTNTSNEIRSKLQIWYYKNLKSCARLGSPRNHGLLKKTVCFFFCQNKGDRCPPGPPDSAGPGLELQIMMASSFESNIHEDLEEEIMNLVDAQAAPDRLKRHTGWNVKISCFRIQQPILNHELSSTIITKLVWSSQSTVASNNRIF